MLEAILILALIPAAAGTLFTIGVGIMFAVACIADSFK